MNLFSRLRRQMLSAFLAAGVLGGLVAAAAPAHAATAPHFTNVVGGPGEILIQGSGFTPGSTVRLEVLTMDLGEVLQTRYVPTDDNGDISQWPGVQWRGAGYAYLDLEGYTGDVRVAADGTPGPTAWAVTHVYPMPRVFASYLGGGIVQVTGSGFQAGDTVRLELMSADSSGNPVSVMDSTEVTINSDGTIPYNGPSAYIGLTAKHGYTGNAIVFADEFNPGPQTVGSGTYIS